MEEKKYQIPISSIITLPIVHNIISEEVINTIPEDKNVRREFVLRHLQNHVPAIYSKALGKWVVVINLAIKEIASHAAKSRNSVVVALNLNQIVEQAVVIKTHIEPHSKREIRDFRFKEMKILAAHLEGYGQAKVTVGRITSGKHLIYCVTSLVIE